MSEVPEGWQLVPKEPTGEMVGAGLRHHEMARVYSALPDAYRAMLTAAPSLPLQEGPGREEAKNAIMRAGAVHRRSAHSTLPTPSSPSSIRPQPTPQ